jgi:sugar lactone lactonase YvrE
VAVGPDSAWYISAFGKFDNGADGAVYRADPDNGTREVYARGLEDPCGVLFVGTTLWVADRKGVYRVNRGKVELVYPEASFPRKLHFLNDLAPGLRGRMYVSDTGDSTAGCRGLPGRVPSSSHRASWPRPTWSSIGKRRQSTEHL